MVTPLLRMLPTAAAGFLGLSSSSLSETSQSSLTSSSDRSSSAYLPPFLTAGMAGASLAGVDEEEAGGAAAAGAVVSSSEDASVQEARQR